jgi:hypothetical protein
MFKVGRRKSNSVVVAAVVCMLMLSLADVSLAADSVVTGKLRQVVSSVDGLGDKHVPAAGRKEAEMRAQQPALDLIEAVESYAKSHGLNGYVQAGIDPKTNAVTIYWHGEVPAQLGEYAESKRGATGLSFSVVPYSYDELVKEARRIITENSPKVISASPNSDFSGISVGVNPAKANLQSLSISSSMPIQLTYADSYSASSRAADTPPFWGGSLIVDNTSTEGCSTGWTVRKSDGSIAVVTAGHCQHRTSSPWYAGFSDRVVGNEGPKSTATDSMTLEGQTYNPAVYVDGWDSTAGLPVHSWSDAVLGEIICEDGAFSGQVCGSVVDEVGLFIDYGFGTVGPGFTATQPSTSLASAGQGDSGGPAYNQAGRGAGQIKLRGMIDAQNTNAQYIAPCVGIGDRQCSRKQFHATVNAINSALSVTPVT